MRTARPGRRVPPLTAVLLGALAAAGLADPAHAEEPKGRIGLTARLEPADLGPGGSGLLVVKGTTGDLHLYADGSEVAQWRAIPVAGVTYGTPETPTDWAKKPAAVEMTPPHPYQDPNLPDPYPVWEGTFEMKVPVRIEASVAPGTEIGLLFDYSACDKESCYRRQKGHRVVARLAGTPAAAPAAPAPAPKARVGAPCGNKAADVLLAVEEGTGGAGVAVVTFRPRPGYHLYLPGHETGLPIAVEPLAGDGLLWGPVPALPETGAFEEPHVVRIPFTRTAAKRLSLKVSWQGCDSVGLCERPEDCTLSASWDPEQRALENAVPSPPVPPGPPPTPPAPGPGPAIGPAPAPVAQPPSGGVIFPVVPAEDGDAKAEEDLTFIERRWRDSRVLAFLILLATGLGLAFTPCVFPLIPITISVISGGRADLPKARLTVLLLAYVAGLMLAFGTMGLVAAFTGSSMAAVFQTPAALWSIAILFVVLAFGMLGVYEMQPPQWMLRLQGGAHRRGGSIAGALLLGGIAAVIASPCTAPVVAGLLVLTAKAANPVLGFTMFATVALGMGAVLFAAGSLNLLLRPGPWMVWVRYVFGVILVGVALYYLANAEMIPPTALFVIGFGIAILAWVLIAWHLSRKEGAPAKEARMRGFQVALLLIAATGAVAFLTKPPAAAEGLQHLGWTKLRDVDHLRQEVEAATKAGEPVVVDVGASWCNYCKEYERLVNTVKSLNDGFAEVRRLQIDVTDDDRVDLRRALGIPTGSQPYMVLLDRQGRILRAAEVKQWYEDRKGSIEALEKRLEMVLSSSRAATP